MSLLRRIRSATDPRYRRQRRLLREYVEAVLLEQGIALEHGEAGALIPLSAQCLADRRRHRQERRGPARAVVDRDVERLDCNQNAYI